MDGAESAAATTLRGTRRSPRLAQLMEGANVYGTLAAKMAKTRTHAAVMPHDVLKARAWGADGVTEMASNMVRKWSTGLLDTIGDRLRPRCGGAEEKPQLPLGAC